jgi:uncharacterized membrane protein
MLVGSAQGPDQIHAFLYDKAVPDQLIDLGGSTRKASGINNLGQIVGAADFGPFLYDGVIVRELNSLLPANSGWVRSKPPMPSTLPER